MSFRAKVQKYRLVAAAKRRAEDREQHSRRLFRVNRSDLVRLRRPGNRLESLSYGPDQKQVCLNCGVILDGSVYRGGLFRQLPA
jgi:hypothetical protein